MIKVFHLINISSLSIKNSFYKNNSFINSFQYTKKFFSKQISELSKDEKEELKRESKEELKEDKQYVKEGEKVQEEIQKKISSIYKKYQEEIHTISVTSNDSKIQEKEKNLKKDIMNTIRQSRKEFIEKHQLPENEIIRIPR
jgi:seryl-tRNA synthetase